jgi:hypothetical protein
MPSVDLWACLGGPRQVVGRMQDSCCGSDLLGVQPERLPAFLAPVQERQSPMPNVSDESPDPQPRHTFEEKGAGDVAVNVALWVAEQSAAGVVGGAAAAAAIHAKDKVMEKLPGSKPDRDD